MSVKHLLYMEVAKLSSSIFRNTEGTPHKNLRRLFFGGNFFFSEPPLFLEPSKKRKIKGKEKL